MAKKRKNLSISDLEGMLEQRLSHLTNLIERRKDLQDQISNLDREIQAVGGGAGAAPKAKVGLKVGVKKKVRRRRPKNQAALPTVVRETLAAHKDGLTTSDLEAAVLATGYKTNSKNFRAMIYQCLGKDKNIVHDKATKHYRLKK